MARIKKKGTTGQAKNFITRTQAVRKLQISLPDFRRLCIFKGIYPREPRNKKKVSKSSSQSTTFYYTKDIQYLLHEPLLAKFREHKALAKKIGRALGRGEVGDAVRLEKATPRMTLDHIIKERYPTFVDALRDLDDCLSMLFLFANLPSTAAVPPKTVALCQRLCLEFEHYLIISHSLRKSFLSIKGIYYQATVQGQDILWLVPYRFVQNVSGDIDFRIMGTFVEFYTTLLGFVNYRLYTSAGLVYPPKFDAKSDEQGGELGAFKIEGRAVGQDTKALTNGVADMAVSARAQEEADKLAAVEEPEEEQQQPEQQQGDAEATEGIDRFETTAEDADVLVQPQFSSSAEAGSLFKDFTFFLSRETPRQPLEFLLKAFGCQRVGWDAVLGDGAFTTNESDPTITHQIVDRPAMPQDALPAMPRDEDGEAPSTRLRPGTRVAGRTYVQPQWVWDCVNEGKLLRPDLYAPGASLPPHLSPWVKPTKGQYDPTLSLAEQEKEGEAEAALEDDEEEDEEDEEVDTAEPVNAPNGTDALLDRKDGDAEAGEGMDVAGTDEEEDEDEEDQNVDDFGGFSEEEDVESEDEEEQARSQHQRELEAEAAGLPFSSTVDAGSTPGKALKSKARKQAEKKRKADEEEMQRQMMMMPRKKKKLLGKMLYSNKQTEDQAEKLRAKRRKLETGKARS